MRSAITIFVALLGMGLLADTPPTYKGLVCIGWIKPEQQSIADGDSAGDELVINTPLNDAEKRQLYYARQAADAAFKEQEAVEESILANHHLLFPTKFGRVRADGCGISPMIRSDEYHITQFVPANPKYPNDEAAKWNMSDGSGKCRAQFTEMRRRAVKAHYGHTAEEDWKP